MKETKLTRSPTEAARFIIEGGIVAFPTETVYGLGASLFNGAAAAKIFEAKRRPADNPLIAHISSIDQINEIVTEITGNAKRFIERFFPGPLTVVLQKSSKVPDVVTAGLDSIAFRMPGLKLTNEFLQACGVPVSAPSANLSGRPSPTTWQAVYEDLNGRIDCILQGDPTAIGLESTVVDCLGNDPLVLRKGAVSVEELRSVVPQTQVYSGFADLALRSPGMRHKHYSPKATIVIVEHFVDLAAAAEASAYIGMGNAPGAFQFSKIVRSSDEYAHKLFEFFRECDRRGIETIYCQAIERIGIGAALMDRIERAADASED